MSGTLIVLLNRLWCMHHTEQLRHKSPHSTQFRGGPE